MKISEHRLWTAVLHTLAFLLAAGLLTPAPAQSISGNADTIRGVVVNSATHEPISRALVFSPDNRFATMTNSEGRFEFNVSHAETTSEGSTATYASNIGQPIMVAGRPYLLTARKPGFLTDPGNPMQNLQNENVKDVTITLIPEGLIVGSVSLPSSEAPDKIMVQIFRRQVQEGHARWVPAGAAQSTSDGQFRFADLSAGTYKLITHESLDRDPLSLDPFTIAPGNRTPAKLFGYPPVYYQNASDFGSATVIHVSAGQTQIVNLTLARRQYYPVKVPVISDNDNPLNVEVYSHGKGPGFSLAHDPGSHAIQGWLPNGTYTIEASNYGPQGLSGSQTINVRGGPVEGPAMTLGPNASIPVIVKEEFASDDPTGTVTYSINGRRSVIKGPRRYLYVLLEPADDLGTGRMVPMREPTKPGDDALFIDGAPPGAYWVRVHSSRGYPASIRSGNLDLRHQPLVVGLGGGASPIEITMRDDTGEINGTVTGLAPPPGSGTNGSLDSASAGAGQQAMAHIYFVPLPDSSGQFSEIWSAADGSFTSPMVPPGAYRVLAFDREMPDLEYQNPAEMLAYDSKGPVVRLLPGQKETVQLQLISTGNLTE